MDFFIEDSSSTMKIAQAHCLMNFLKEKQTPVLAKNKRLTLSTTLLNMISEILYDLNNELYENQTLFPDAMYIKEFIKSVGSVKVIQNNHHLKGAVDLRSFENLRSLEINTIPIEMIIGLKSLSKQLETLIIINCSFHLRDLLKLNLDFTLDLRWTKLEYLIIRKNELTHLGGTLKHLPNVKLLDASFNKLTAVDNMYLLKNLEVLDLGYNHIETFPACSSNFKYHLALKTLILRNNFLGNLNGLGRLINVSNLDLRDNCILSTSFLIEIKSLSLLKILQLRGNPLMYEKKYRTKIKHFAAKKALTQGIVIDGKLILEINLDM